MSFSSCLNVISRADKYPESVFCWRLAASRWDKETPSRAVVFIAQMYKRTVRLKLHHLFAVRIWSYGNTVPLWILKNSIVSSRARAMFITPRMKLKAKKLCSDTATILFLEGFFFYSHVHSFLFFRYARTSMLTVVSFLNEKNIGVIHLFCILGFDYSYRAA